jgi:hypothetical protein
MASELEALDVPKIAGAPRKLVWIGTAATAVITVAGSAYLEFRTSDTPHSIYTYLPHTRAWNGILWISATGIVAAVFCILFGLHFYRTGDSDEALLWRANLRFWKVCFLTPWVILPPAWYCAEYFYVYTPPPFPSPVCLQETPVPAEATQKEACALEMEYRKERIDEFVQGQENTNKAWLAMVTLLAGLYFGKSLGKE